MDVWESSEKLWELPTSSLVSQTSSCISITNRNIENVFIFVNNQFDSDGYVTV